MKHQYFRQKYTHQSTRRRIDHLLCQGREEESRKAKGCRKQGHHPPKFWRWRWRRETLNQQRCIQAQVGRRRGRLHGRKERLANKPRPMLRQLLRRKIRRLRPNEMPEVSQSSNCTRDLQDESVFFLKNDASIDSVGVLDVDVR